MKIERANFLDVREARERLLSKFPVLEVEQVTLSKALGRVLAEDIFANTSLPPFSNSAMDGFALRSIDIVAASEENPVELKVVADIPAGQFSDVFLGPEQAARIMTGAPLPPGADVVVPVEHTNFNIRQPGAPAPESIVITAPENPGAYIRVAGEDLREGERVLQAGNILRPQDVGALSMFGISIAPVRRQPKVAVFSTGDELLPVEKELSAGKIRDANLPVLESLIKKYGGQPVNLGISSDHEKDVQSHLDRAVDQKADLILTSAGVSVGAFDYVRSVVANNGVLDFWRVNMRPGKPLAFGNYRSTPFIGLPGNPVSAFIGFEVFVRPAINKMLSLSNFQRPFRKVRLLEAIHSDGRESYLRAVVGWHNDEMAVRLTGHQGSGNLLSLVQANALLMVPSGVKSLKIGDLVDAWLMDGEIPIS